MYVNIFPLIKLLFWGSLVFMSVKYLMSLKNVKRKNKKSIGYFMKRNTKIFFKNKYSKFNLQNKEENKKVYNLKGDDVIRYVNGDIYKGEIKNGIREGLGTCYFANKDRYEGMWKNDKMDCVGKYVFADRSFYSGDFQNGCKEGIGVFTCDDYKYVGQYYADRKGRVGTFHLKDNAYLKVIIENGTIIEGTYIREGMTEEYIYNVDLSNEREVIKNIHNYFKRDVSNI